MASELRFFGWPAVVMLHLNSFAEPAMAPVSGT
jgi:hypothetical protein